MRPGQQQNKQRMRGRGGRKGPNPMSRSFESNGPDVKIRGTAQHIADKYMALARDAGAAGDRVMAENYLQHAEHYGRIVAAAMGQFQPSQPERDYADFDEDGEEEGLGSETGQPFGGAQERPQNGFNGERAQNGGERQGGERHPNDRQGFRDGQNGQGPRGDRRDNRGDRPFQNRDGQNRDGQSRDNQNRDGFARDNGYRDDRGRDDRRDRGERDNRQPGTGPQPFVQAPEFEAEGGAPRQDGSRFEGGRRESRRERARLNERSGERRFEERFGRPRQGDEARGDAPAERQDAVGELPAFVTTPAPVPAAAPAPAEPVAIQPSASATGGDFAEEAKGAEPRARGRRRREELSENAASAEAAASPVAPAAPAVAMSEEASPAPAPRRRAPKAAPAIEAPVAVEDEAAPKRRVAKPRRKKDEGEADGGDSVPALVTSDT